MVPESGAQEFFGFFGHRRDVGYVTCQLTLSQVDLCPESIRKSASALGEFLGFAA